MPINIEGTSYYSANELAREVGVSRQTLYRWRQEGKIPPGCRFRDGRVLFSEVELNAALEFANRLEPLGVGGQGPGLSSQGSDTR